MEIKNNFKKIFYWLVVIVFIFISFFFYTDENNNLKNNFQLFRNSQNWEVKNIQYVKIAGQNIKVELAIFPETQEKGFSGRNNLEEKEGMLFIFDKIGQHSFWMKDMNFPIDIIWLNKDLQVIFIKKNALPESYPETFSPEKDSKYVLEVISGFSEKNNLKEGDSVEFLP